MDVTIKRISYVNSLKSNDGALRELEILKMWLYREAQRLGVTEHLDNYNWVAL